MFIIIIIGYGDIFTKVLYFMSVNSEKTTILLVQKRASYFIA